MEKFYEELINHISSYALLFGGETDNMCYDIRKAVYKILSRQRIGKCGNLEIYKIYTLRS